MRKTETALHGKARLKILRGVKAVAEAVKVSLGPEGAGALIHRSFNRGSRITNDGVTIAKCVEPRDNFENLAATAFKEAASKTGEKVGDGTTTTIVIADNLITNAFRQLKGTEKSDVQLRGIESPVMGVNSLRKSILAEIPKIKEAIAKVTKKVESKEELTNIADVSLGGNKEVAEVVADMVWKTGTDGFITLSDGFQGKLETEMIEGARFPAKIAAMKAGKNTKGAVMSSDAFFPFRDSVDEAAKAGITAIIQTGGSIRDEEVIKAADEHNIAMVFTGIRLFKH